MVAFPPSAWRQTCGSLHRQVNVIITKHSLVYYNRFPILSIVIALSETIIRYYFRNPSSISKAYPSLLMLTVVIVNEDFFSGGYWSSELYKKIPTSFVNPAIVRCGALSLVLKQLSILVCWLICLVAKSSWPGIEGHLKCPQIAWVRIRYSELLLSFPSNMY